MMSSHLQLAEDAGPCFKKEDPRVLRERLAEVVARFPNQRAIVSMYQSNDGDAASSSIGNRYNDDDPRPYLTWTYAQLDSKADRLARMLYRYHGIRSGVRIVAFLPSK